MVEIVHLGPNEMPPAGERFLLQEWKPGEGMQTNVVESGIVHRTPTHLWDSMLAENLKNAAQSGYSKLYVKGRPSG